MMQDQCRPVVGQWYSAPLEPARLFEVVGIDELTGEVALQFVDGANGAFDEQTWYQLKPCVVADEQAWMVSESDVDLLECDDLNSHDHTQGLQDSQLRFALEQDAHWLDELDDVDEY